MDFVTTSLIVFILYVILLAVDRARIASTATLRDGCFEIHTPAGKNFGTHLYWSCGPHSFCSMALGFFQGKAANWVCCISCYFITEVNPYSI